MMLPGAAGSVYTMFLICQFQFSVIQQPLRQAIHWQVWIALVQRWQTPAPPPVLLPRC
jgi:hypothetical protein